MKNGMAPGNCCILEIRSLHWDMADSKPEKIDGTKLEEALPPTEMSLIVSVSLWGNCSQIF